MRDFTDYSCPRNSFARIDHIFKTFPMSLNPSVWSDHSAVYMTLQHPSGKKHGRRWRLNESILSDPIRVLEIERAIKYFIMNDTLGVSQGTNWAAHKATVRGKLTQIAS